jgi:hypothetical protein
MHKPVSYPRVELQLEMLLGCPNRVFSIGTIELQKGRSKNQRRNASGWRDCVERASLTLWKHNTGEYESDPLNGTPHLCGTARVAQGIEREIPNFDVAGSIPAAGAVGLRKRAASASSFSKP